MNGRKGKTEKMAKAEKSGRTGRPKKNGEKLRSFTITAAPTELQLWKEAAARVDRSLSAWVRLILNQKVADNEIRTVANEREAPGKGRSRGETDSLAAVPAGGAGGDVDRG